MTQYTIASHFWIINLCPCWRNIPYLTGMPITNQDSFSCLEEVPQDHTLARFTALKVSDINSHMTTKGGILGLPTKFFIGQAQLFIKKGNTLAFEAVLLY